MLTGIVTATGFGGTTGFAAIEVTEAVPGLADFPGEIPAPSNAEGAAVKVGAAGLGLEVFRISWRTLCGVFHSKSVVMHLRIHCMALILKWSNDTLCDKFHAHSLAMIFLSEVHARKLHSSLIVG